ncbi:unnamed protein product [Calypogeia fissa]
MDSRAPNEGELPMPMLDGFGGGLHESSMMKLLTSAMDELPSSEGKVPPKIINDTENYRECLRNHRASAGDHAIDGCGEFMPGGIGETMNSMKCAACGCHRNFHKREEDSEASEEDLQRPKSGVSAGLHDSSSQKVMTTGQGTGKDEIRPSEANKVHNTARYLECLRNHQVRIGGHAFDGCQEFIAGGEEGTVDALKCAACECHRSFHRREVEGEEYYCDCHQIRNKETIRTSGGVPHTSLSTGPTDSDDQDGGSSASAGARKKRVRTKFSVEQTEKMRSFAEKLGWKTQKDDEGPAQAFCAGIGVSRQLFKVWMHNNKGKRARD